MGHYHDLIKDAKRSNQELREHIPEVYRGFSNMSRAALTDGALGATTKELMALAISVVEGCDACIATHARGAARKGASNAEVAESIGVAILMAGGPATVYGPRAWDAYKEFTEPA